MAVTIEQIKELRDATGMGIMDCRKALEESDGVYDKAVEVLNEKGLATAAERADREVCEGIVELYSHGDGRIGVMVEINCETDFVSRSEVFRTFAHEIALQIAAGAPIYLKPEDIPEEVIEKEKENARNLALEEGKPEKIVDRIIKGRLEKFKDEACLMRQDYIRDDDITIEKLLLQTIASIGENIVISRFMRWELGENAEQ